MSDHDNRGKFAKGNQAGSKSKRVKGVAAYIMEKTNNLRDIVDIAVNIVVTVPVTAQDKQERRWAMDYLTDRAIGKPTQVNENEHTIKSPLDVLLDIVDKRTSNE